MLFLMLKRIHTIMPFSPSSTIFSSHGDSNWIATFSAYLASWNNLCLCIKLSVNCWAPVPYIPEAWPFIKICLQIPLHLLAWDKNFISSHLRLFLIIYSLSVTQREPSLVLVGQATRLSMVCGYPNFCPLSA